MIYIGIDNGVTGAVSILNAGGEVLMFMPTPVVRCLNYTKAVAWISRVDIHTLKSKLHEIPDVNKSKCMIERPLVNPMRFKATVSAMRALEATVIVLEDLGIPYEYIDSRGWQKDLLPSGIVGSSELKAAAIDVAKRMFPAVALPKGSDADSLMIAEFCRRKYVEVQRK